MSNHAAAIPTLWLDRFIVNQGLSKQQLFINSGITGYQPNQPLAHMGYLDYLKLVDHLSCLLEKPDIGLDLPKVIDEHDWGPVFLMVLQSPTLVILLENLKEFLPLISTGVFAEFDVDYLHSEFAINYVIPNRPGIRIDTDINLCTVLEIIQSFVGDDWLPVKVNMSYAKPENLDRLHATFGPNIAFDQPQNSIVFESCLLNSKHNDENPELYSLLNHETFLQLKQLTQKKDLLSDIRAFITSTIGNEQCNSKNIAQQLNMSQRSMVRHLTKAGTSFRELKLDIIEQMTKLALRESEVSVYEIALRMGFAETSPLNRMFKNKTGYTPLQYRELSRQESQLNQ